MREARNGKKMVTAAPDSPDEARCPSCGYEVRKRKRRRMDKTVSWFYRHKKGSPKDCPERYQFGS